MNTVGVIVASPDPRRNDQPASSEELARSVPVTVNGQTVGNVLALDQPFARNSAEQRYLERTSLALGAAAAIAVGIALVLGIVLARFITRPVRDLTAAVKAIAGGDLYQQQVSLHVQAESGLPALYVDENRIARTLGNLVSNALRYTPAGGGVTLEAHHADGGVALVVADTGSGIPEEHLPNVFERFYRTDRSRSNETGGSGLGLSIVKSIVEAHGGSVDVTSRVGQGTTFTIVLPV